jgi:twitching motility protein PilU
VLATLHANNSYNALNRIISFYPIENRAALLQDLSSTVKAIVSQRLVRSINGGTRSAAVEVMVNTRYISDLIEKGEIGQIKEAMERACRPARNRSSKPCSSWCRMAWSARTKRWPTPIPPPTCCGY